MITVIVVGICIAVLLYLIADSFFENKYERFISGCYFLAIWIFIIFTILAYFFPSLIGGEAWGYFIIYAPLLMLLVFFPLPISPIIFAHIACAIKYRGHDKSREPIETLWWAAIILYFVFVFLAFAVPPFIFVGMLLITVASVYRIIRLIIRLIKR